MILSSHFHFTDYLVLSMRAPKTKSSSKGCRRFRFTIRNRASIGAIACVF